MSIIMWSVAVALGVSSLFLWYAYPRACARCGVRCENKGERYDLYDPMEPGFVKVCGSCWRDEKHAQVITERKEAFEKMVEEEMLREQARHEARRRLSAQAHPYRES